MQRENKRSCTTTNHQATNSNAGTSNNSNRKKSPIEFAADHGKMGLETLHKESQVFLMEILLNVLHTYAKYHHKNENYQKKLNDPEYIPKSCKKVNFSLQAREKVKSSEGYKAACVRVTEIIKDAQSKLKVEALYVDDMNCRDLGTSFVSAYVTGLPKAASVLLAQFGISSANYGPHHVMMDLLSEFSCEVTSVIKVNLKDFLGYYVRENKIATPPMPSKTN